MTDHDIKAEIETLISQEEEGIQNLWNSIVRSIERGEKVPPLYGEIRTLSWMLNEEGQLKNPFEIGLSPLDIDQIMRSDRRANSNETIKTGEELFNYLCEHERIEGYDFSFDYIKAAPPELLTGFIDQFALRYNDQAPIHKILQNIIDASAKSDRTVEVKEELIPLNQAVKGACNYIRNIMKKDREFAGDKPGDKVEASIDRLCDFLSWAILTLKEPHTVPTKSAAALEKEREAEEASEYRVIGAAKPSNPDRALTPKEQEIADGIKALLGISEPPTTQTSEIEAESVGKALPQQEAGPNK